MDWAGLQPDPARPPDLAQPDSGCLRGTPPCGAYAGIRARLQALAARQRADGGGWAVTVVLYGVPDWAAAPPTGCERPGTAPRSRPITAAGLAGYRALIRDLLALGRREHVELRSWSPFNEPNHPAFISPQRAACRVSSPTLSAGVYARLVRAARAELAADAAPHDLVLGELAGVPRPSARTTGVGEFVRALPDDVACAGAVWAQHTYARPGGGGPDAVAELEQALDARPCTAGKPVWVTETGVALTHGGRGTSPRAQATQCAAQATLLERWARDRRVRAVFQYTAREDTAYPVGLFDAGLTRSYRTLALWQAWALARPGGPPPRRPAGCR